jgi:hypothetical protein
MKLHIVALRFGPCLWDHTVLLATHTFYTRKGRAVPSNLHPQFSTNNRLRHNFHPSPTSHPPGMPTPIDQVMYTLIWAWKRSVTSFAIRFFCFLAYGFLFRSTISLAIFGMVRPVCLETDTKFRQTFLEKSTSPIVKTFFTESTFRSMAIVAHHHKVGVACGHFFIGRSLVLAPPCTGTYINQFLLFIRNQLLNNTFSFRAPLFVIRFRWF